MDWFPKFGNRQLADISRKEIQDNIMRIMERSSGATSNRHLSLITKVYSLAIELETFTGDNPCSKLKKFQESSGRERFLSKEEIKRFLEALDECKESPAALGIQQGMLSRAKDCIGVGTVHWFAPPLPPNRTGGSPASGSPVGGFHQDTYHKKTGVPHAVTPVLVRWTDSPPPRSHPAQPLSICTTLSRMASVDMPW